MIMIVSLLELHVLGEAVDVADIPVMIIVGHVEGRRAARGSDVAARWWERHVTPQPEHMPSRWCPGFAGRPHTTVEFTETLQRGVLINVCGTSSRAR